MKFSSKILAILFSIITTFAFAVDKPVTNVKVFGRSITFPSSEINPYIKQIGKNGFGNLLTVQLGTSSMKSVNDIDPTPFLDHWGVEFSFGFLVLIMPHKLIRGQAPE